MKRDRTGHSDLNTSWTQGQKGCNAQVLTKRISDQSKRLNLLKFTTKFAEIYIVSQVGTRGIDLTYTVDQIVWHTSIVVLCIETVFFLETVHVT